MAKKTVPPEPSAELLGEERYRFTTMAPVSGPELDYLLRWATAAGKEPNTVYELLSKEERLCIRLLLAGRTRGANSPVEGHLISRTREYEKYASALWGERRD